MSDDSEEGRLFGGGAPGERALIAAVRSLRMGHLEGAVMHLRRLLGSDPTHAEGHALLARVLVSQKRLFAAEHEARAALAIEPELVAGHLALALVLVGNRKLKEARVAFERVVTLAPDDAAPVLGLATLARLEGRREDEHRELLRALELDEESEETLVALGVWHLEGGRLEEADAYAQQARALVADDADVLILLGHLALRRGDVQAARDHALWALQQGPMNVSALSLLASIQARQSVLLGLWWRSSVWMQARGERGQIAILIVGWLSFRVAELVSGDLGTPGLARGFEYVWLGICVYSWVGPALFARAIEKELAQVRLRGDF